MATAVTLTAGKGCVHAFMHKAAYNEKAANAHNVSDIEDKMFANVNK